MVRDMRQQKKRNLIVSVAFSYSQCLSASSRPPVEATTSDSYTHPLFPIHGALPLWWLCGTQEYSSCSRHCVSGNTTRRSRHDLVIFLASVERVPVAFLSHTKQCHPRCRRLCFALIIHTKGGSSFFYRSISRNI